MKKQIYTAPAMEVSEMDVEVEILAGSSDTNMAHSFDGTDVYNAGIASGATPSEGDVCAKPRTITKLIK